MTGTRIYEITHRGNARSGLMAWLGDGRTLQYMSETGQFHDNPALSDDFIQEQYNLYEEIGSSRAIELMDTAAPFDPESLGWLAERFALQPSGARFDPKRLGLDAPSRAANAGSRTPTRHTRAAFSGAVGVPTVDWLRGVFGLDETFPDVVRDTVETLLSRALGAEPSITDDLIACSEVDVLLGLEHRVKSPPSLARKVDMWFMARTVTASRLRPFEVVAPIPDLVRYTLVATDHQQMLHTAQQVARRIAERGHRVVVAEHSYRRGNFYKGFKSVWEAPSGMRWELQFRSELNLAYKDRAYLHYKASRDLTRSVAERRESLGTTSRIYDALPAPDGLDSSPLLAGVPVRERVFLSPFGNDASPER